MNKGMWLVQFGGFVVSALIAVYFILTGQIPVRGTTVYRETNPSTFWFGVGLFGVVAGFFLAEAFFPNWGFRVLEWLGFLKHAAN